MASRFVLPFADVGNGISPSDGAQLFFFETGTSTPKDTYSDAAGTTANANPVVSDSDGVFSDIFIVGSYKVQLKDKNGVQLWESDPVVAFSESSGASTVYATVAAMVAASPDAGTTVETQGYLAAGDGGGAKYLVQTSGAFGGTPDETGDHTLANGNIAALEELPDIIGKQVGLLPGTVTIATYKNALVRSQAEEKDILFEAGTYDFGGLDVSNGGLSNGQDVGDLRIRGIEGQTIFEDVGSNHHSGYISSVGIKYTNSIQPIYMTGNVSFINVRHCEFDNVRRAIYHNDTTASVKISGGLIEHNTFKDRIEDDFLGCILLHRAEFADDIVVQYNKASGYQSGTLANVFIFCQIGKDDAAIPVTNYNRNKQNHNTILNCGNFRTDSLNASFGCIAIGTDIEQCNNVVKDCGWMNGIYAKGNDITQCFNKIHQVEWSGVTIKVKAGTIASERNLQMGNIVTGVCDRKAAIRAFGNAQSLNNTVDTTTTAEVDATEGGFSFRATRSTTLGPLKVTGTYKSTNGIQITAAGDVAIDARIESSDKGIEIFKSTDGDLENVSISGKIIAAQAAINVNWCKQFDSNGLSVSCNRHDGNSIFIYTQDRTNLRGLALHVTDTGAGGQTITTPIALFAKDGGSLTNHSTLVDDLQFVTDRNFTEVIRHNADAGLLSPSKSKFQISDTDIDLNGKTGSFLARCNTSMMKVSLQNVEVEGSFTRTIDGASVTIDDLLINQNLMNYVATDDVAGHTNATATASRIGDNKTA